MEEVKRIYVTEFVEWWENQMYPDWDGKFSAKAKTPIREYKDGCSLVCFEPRENFWCYLWNGPHCVFGAKELIPGQTIVTGCKCEPMFYTPQEFVELFDMDFRNPFTGKHELEGTRYHSSVLKIQKQILANAQR